VYCFKGNDILSEKWGVEKRENTEQKKRKPLTVMVGETVWRMDNRRGKYWG